MSEINYKIRKVVVLGSGVMGSQIAAHCVNAGLEVTLLDLKSDDPARPNKIAEESIQKILKMKPAPFALPGYASRIQVGNFEDDFDHLKDADWICEVIIERMDIKQKMMSRIDKVRGKHAIVSSNTSGLPISEICEGCSEGFRQHFLGTHFFNPPRYMKLLELIPTADTFPEIVSYMKRFSEKMLGKGVVVCKDTPNFIANRVGVFSMASILPYFFNGDFRAEHIDELTGTLTGYSKAATFRTGDMVGLDVLDHVASNLYPAVPDDEKKEVFQLPEKFKEMIRNGKTGNKGGQGFYKKVQTKEGREFQIIDPETLEYGSQEKLESEIVQEAKKIKDTKERLKFLSFHDSDIGQFIWELQRDLLLYAANRIPEITELPESIDRAMKWGFNWELGPFERWDALGVSAVVERIKKEGFKIPDLVSNMLDAGFDSFYDGDKVYDPASCEMVKRSPNAEGEIKIADVRASRSPVLENESAALHDLGDGVALFEFKTKNATLGFELVQSLEQSLGTVEKYFKALVISHDGENFAYGANLAEAVQAVQSGNFDQVVEAVSNFQRTAVKLRYASFPVIAAPFGRALGGGTEFSLYSDKIVAHHELYMGLVEIGVGLIPAGGGTTEMLKRYLSKVRGDADPLTYIKEAFKVLGMGQVSDSAAKARELGYLKEYDLIVMNRDLLIQVAKEEALGMVEAGYHPPAKEDLQVFGVKSLSALKVMTYILQNSKFVGEYGRILGDRIAFVMSGGELSEPQHVPEDYLLKLEREAILECFKDERTHKMIGHMLKTGKPLMI